MPAQQRTAQLDLDYVHSRFPAFQDPIAKDTVFLENASGSYMVNHVLNKLTEYNRVRVQPYGYNPLLDQAGQRMDAGRQCMAQLLGLENHELHIGPSTTQNLNTLAMACEPLLAGGGEILISEQEHEANIGAWERLCERKGAKLHFWPVDPVSTELDLARLADLLNPKTRILCLTHSSNILGSVNPIRQAATLCRANGTRIVVDGVSYAPHRWPDIKSLNVDTYCFSTYKTYGTHQGIMYINPDFLRELNPQCHFFLEKNQHKRLDTAGPDHGSIAALSGLGDYWQESYRHHFDDSSETTLQEKALSVSALMHEHETSLCAKLIADLQDLPVKILGRQTEVGREANLALIFDQVSPATVSRELAKQHIAASASHFYAARLLKSLSIDPDSGVLRISMAHYNSTEDIERLSRALTKILS